MNKSLEKEYIELITENTPNLWERIEAGLEPKELTAEKGNPWRRYRTWGLAAAACLCIMVTVPVMLRKDADGNMEPNSIPAYDAGMADVDIADVGMADGNFSIADNAGALPGVSSAEDIAAVYTIMGTVTEVTEEEGRRVYIVDIFRTDLTELSEGDSIRLYSELDFDEEILEGEEYLFDIAVSIDNNGTREYLIEDIW